MEPNQIKQLRKQFGTQAQAAETLGINAWTLRNWEQGKRAPSGAAAVLLRVLEAEPKAVLRALAKKK